MPYRYDATGFRAVFEESFTYIGGVERNGHRYAGRPALHDPPRGAGGRTPSCGRTLGASPPAWPSTASRRAAWSSSSSSTGPSSPCCGWRPSSGTTGMPKGVSLPGLVEILSAHDVIMHFPLSPEDRTLNMTPWFHRGGLYSGGPNPVFYAGAEAVSLRAFDAATVLDLVAEHRLRTST